MKKYELLKQVGEGSFGQVFKARRKCDGAIVAYKVTSKTGRTPKELKSLKRECEIQKGMRHPNIIQMFDSFETDTKIVVVTEYVEKELYEILAKAGQLSEMRAQVIACDLVSALHYLHSKRIVHRDMKPQNVLLDTNGVAKLCDFGFARIMSLGTHVLMSVKGTPLYMAPELIDELPYDHNVDLWSLGCIVYELVTGKPPFQTLSMRHLIKLIKHEEIKWPEHISGNLKSFLQGLLQKQSSERLTWPELLEHPFVKGRILTVDEEAPRALTSPLSASQARAKQQQLQSLASRFTSQSKKILEKQIKKIHSQVLRKSEASGSESGASVDVLLNNLSLRASLRSDLLAADYAICQTDCPIDEEQLKAEQQQLLLTTQAQHDCPGNAGNANQTDNPSSSAKPSHLVRGWHSDTSNTAAAATVTIGATVTATAGINQCKSEFSNATSCLSASLEEDSLQNEEHKPHTPTDWRFSSEQDTRHQELAERRARLKDWTEAREAEQQQQPIENEEWLVFLQHSMEEMMEGELGSLLQENCMSVFASPLRNPGSSCRVVERVACLLSLPFVLSGLGPDELERVQRIYLELRVAPDLVRAAARLLAAGPSSDELQALESVMLLLCRLVHAGREFLVQFCDALFLLPDGIALFQRLLRPERRKPRLLSDLLAIFCEVLRSGTGNAELVERLLFYGNSTDDSIDLFSKLVTHEEARVRSRVCVLLLLLGKFSRGTLQRIWGKSLRNLVEALIQDQEKFVRDAVTDAVSFLKQLPFYDQHKDTWNVIET